jgi:nucleotide sugar dehydrogenase
MSSTNCVSNQNQEKRLALIGVGRLGLCMALVAERAGYDVLGVDVLPQYVDAINNRSLKSNEPKVVEYLRAAKRLKASTELDEAIEFSDHLMVLVATPSTGGTRHYDVTQLSRVLMHINRRRPRNKVITICCTVMPGYIATVGRALLADCENVQLQYNPEFIQQGNIIEGLERPDTVLIGESSTYGGDLVERLWRSFVRNPDHVSVHRMSPESAEIAKLALNCFITMKISFANFIGDVADRTPNADKHAILGSIGADSRVGPKCLLPGYGFGGPCFPRDNRAFGGYAESIGIDPMISRATDTYNERHAAYMAEALLLENRPEYVFEGVTYKHPCAVPIIEESQKLAVAARVAKAGKKVTICDRREVIEACKMEWGSLFTYHITDDLLSPGLHSPNGSYQTPLGCKPEGREPFTPPRSAGTGDVCHEAALNALDPRHGSIMDSLGHRK